MSKKKITIEEFLSNHANNQNFIQSCFDMFEIEYGNDIHNGTLLYFKKTLLQEYTWGCEDVNENPEALRNYINTIIWEQLIQWFHKNEDKIAEQFNIEKFEHEFYQKQIIYKIEFDGLSEQIKAFSERVFKAYLNYPNFAQELMIALYDIKHENK